MKTTTEHAGLYPDSPAIDAQLRAARRERSRFVVQLARRISGSSAAWREVVAFVATMAVFVLLLWQAVPTTATASMAAMLGVTPAIEGGDSRLNNYQLERDSCCVGEK